MLYLLVGLAALITFLFIIKGLGSPNPEEVKKAYKYTMLILGIILVIILFRVGMPLIAAAIGAILAIIPYLQKILQLLYTIKMFRGLFKKPPAPATPQNKMTKKEATEILGVSETSTKQEIDEAYKRLMKKNHPDTGGSKYLASQLNTARETLLKN